MQVTLGPGAYRTSSCSQSYSPEPVKREVYEAISAPVITYCGNQVIQVSRVSSDYLAHSKNNITQSFGPQIVCYVILRNSLPQELQFRRARKRPVRKHMRIRTIELWRTEMLWMFAHRISHCSWFTNLPVPESVAQALSVVLKKLSNSR